MTRCDSFVLLALSIDLSLFSYTQAADSITKIAAVLSTAQIEEHYIPLLKRLSAAEWFTSRTSSAALYPAVYDRVSSAIQDDLRKGFASLGSDDTPMVRRAAAKWLGVSFLNIHLDVLELIAFPASPPQVLRASYLVRCPSYLPQIRR